MKTAFVLGIFAILPIVARCSEPVQVKTIDGLFASVPEKIKPTIKDSKLVFESGIAGSMFRDWEKEKGRLIKFTGWEQHNSNQSALWKPTYPSGSSL